MRNEQLQKIIIKIKQLPTLPQVMTRLMQVIENPDSSASEVSKIISTDQSLMTKVLKLVNSPFYGMPKRIATLSQATVILGFNAIKNLALTAAIFDQFGGEKGAPRVNGFTREKFWEHSVACAIATKIISEHIRYKEPEEAFMSGLIHDIGKVIFDQFMNDEFTEALEYADKHKVRILEAEAQVIGANHTEIGAWLGEKWNLPSHLVSAIRYHHFFQPGHREGKLIASVHLADAIVRMEGYGNGGDMIPPIIDEKIWHVIDLDSDKMPHLLKEVRIGYENAREFLKMVMQ